MSGREWKPGDVASVLNEHGVWNIAICVVGLPNNYWQYGVSQSIAGIDAEARPLVVLDPEADAIRMTEAFYAAGYDIPDGSDPHHYEQMRAALRSLIAPPKPDEPLGLGAVVEDADGERWVHRGRGFLSAWTRCADSVDDAVGSSRSWETLNPIRVLSEGVQS